MSISQSCKITGCTGVGKKLKNGGVGFFKGYCRVHYGYYYRRGLLDTKKNRKYERHGMSSHPLYSTWGGMIQRCYYKDNKHYKDYGGRGIKVCDRWLNSFALFVEDMGEKPYNYTLDRIDVDGNYEPSNCRWTDMYTQALNRRYTPGLSGHKYIKKIKSGKYHVVIYVNQTRILVGTFETIEEAIAKRDEAIALHKT